MLPVDLASSQAADLALARAGQQQHADDRVWAPSVACRLPDRPQLGRRQHPLARGFLALDRADHRVVVDQPGLHPPAVRRRQVPPRPVGGHGARGARQLDQPGRHLAPGHVARWQAVERLPVAPVERPGVDQRARPMVAARRARAGRSSIRPPTVSTSAAAIWASLRSWPGSRHRARRR